MINRDQKVQHKRYEYLDILRGITLISMMLYHGMWDLVYMVGLDIDWYRSEGAHIWQQSICWTFILLAGFCWSFGKRKLKRGLVVFGGGFVITLVTSVLMPNQRVMFGVLTLLGSCMLLMIPLEKILRKIPAEIGLVGFAVCFLLTRNINEGSLGFGEWKLLELPQYLYDCGDVMTYLGFTDRNFWSTDYFSLFPWLFLFITGYFLYRLAVARNVLEHPVLAKLRNKPLAFIGRHSLLIYMIHQPIIYLVIVCFFG